MKKKSEKCSLFEEMLMWTSYRYAIGSKTYVSCLAYEIPQHYYHRLTPERRQFTAYDIRREIYEHLRIVLPFGFRIDRMTDKDKLNPLETLFTFFNSEVDSFDVMQTLANLVYDAHSKTFKVEEKKPIIESSFSISDINHFLPWETFASCFDDSEHIVVNGKTLFKTWQRKLVPVPGREGYFWQADFGWEPIWYDLETFLKNGEYSGYLTEKELKEWQKSK